jgi:tRNA threonylcarbamoyl adenosine modification protein YjeE
MTVKLKNVTEMRNWAANFAKTLRAPATVALHGDLGMGKSEIARKIIQTLAGDATVVPSPTFTIVQSYDAADETHLSHFDLYRVEDVSELTEIGLAHAMQNDITLIEWPEIAAGVLPPDTIHLYLTEDGAGRRLEIEK